MLGKLQRDDGGTHDVSDDRMGDEEAAAPDPVHDAILPVDHGPIRYCARRGTLLADPPMITCSTGAALGIGGEGEGALGPAYPLDPVPGQQVGQEGIVVAGPGGGRIPGVGVLAGL